MYEHHTPEELAKIGRYQHVITDATTYIWAYMAKRAEVIPDEITDLTEAQLEILLDIESVEEEWVIDPDLRKEISIISWEEDVEEG